MARARERRRAGRHTIFFLDEIHRFNKAQQDALLPAVEEGLVVLVGATTENPYFEVNSALISRTQVYELHELTAEDIGGLLRRALARSGASVSDEVIEFLAARSGGDARSSLNALELALDTAARTGEPVTLADAEDAMQRKALRYDKSGDQHYDYISAWIKSTRGSDPDASLYYLAAMLEGGEDARFIVRRMVIFASEDVGNADPKALQVAVAAAHAVEHVGLPECTYALAQAAIYLSLAPKSNAAGQGARRRPRADPRGTARRLPPAPLRSAAYPAARALGRGVGYDYPHDHPGHVNDQEHLPAGREHLRFYDPGDAEPELRARLERIRAARARVTPSPSEVAQPLWSLLPVEARARYIRRASVAMLDELDVLATRLADDTGWPRSQLMLTELLPAARGLRALANDGPGALADRRLAPRVAARGPSRASCRRPSAWSACAGRPRRPGPSRRSRPPPRCWPATPSCSPSRRSGCEPCSCARACRASCSPSRRRHRPGRGVPARGRPPAPGRLGTLLVLGGAPRDRVIEAALWAGFGLHAAAAGRIVAVKGAVPGLVEALTEPRHCASATRGPRHRRHRDAGRHQRRRRRPARPRPAAARLLAVVELPDSEAAIALVARVGRDAPVSIWARDGAQGERVARRLPSPATWVGRHGIATTAVPTRIARHAVPRQLEWRAPGRRHAAPPIDLIAAQRTLPRSATGEKRAAGRRCARPGARRTTATMSAGAPPTTGPTVSHTPLADPRSLAAQYPSRSRPKATTCVEVRDRMSESRPGFRHSSQARARSWSCDGGPAPACP